MKDFTSGLYATMSEKLGQLDFTSNNILQRAERSLSVVEETLVQLKQYVLNYTFNDKQEEIHFFKDIKPMFHRELIYFWEVFQVEQYKPPVGREDVINHYMLGAKRVDFYFKRHNDLYTYYRKGSNNNDERYFLRSEQVTDLLTPISLSDIDPRFSTVYSFQFAKMQAYEKFSAYLQQCINQAEQPKSDTVNQALAEIGLQWVDTNAAAVELIYSLQSEGVFIDVQTKKKAELSKVARFFEMAFGIDLGNYYRTFQELSIRTKGRTPLLHRLITSIVRRMDEPGKR